MITHNDDRQRWKVEKGIIYLFKNFIAVPGRCSAKSDVGEGEGMILIAIRLSML